MSYNPTTQHISAPVSIYDVQRALGLGSPDLGTLIVTGQINKWAKYKPVVYPDVSNSNDGKGTVVRTSSQMKMYGLTAPLITSSTQGAELAGYRAGQSWTYTKPAGGSVSQPFRLTDFAGYNHICPPFAYNEQTQQEEGVFNVFASALIFALGYPDAADYPDCLHLSDFGSGYYTAVVLYQCSSLDPEDMDLWTYVGRFSGTTAQQYRVEIENTNGRFQDQYYYALVPYIGCASPQQRILLPWDSDHFFAYRFKAEGLAFFDVSAAYMSLSGSASYDIQLLPSQMARNYTIGTVSTTVYIRMTITVTRGKNGLNRDLVFGPSSTDRIRFQVNGTGDMYLAQMTNSSGTVISSQTVTVPSVEGQSSTAVIYMKLTNVSTALWNIGSGGLYQSNWLRAFVSHNGGQTWQAGTNYAYEGMAYFTSN
jgi:hypothetical protein